MVENESSSFNLNCFDDDFENIKHIEEINDYYECSSKKCLILILKLLTHQTIADLETHDFIELNWKCPGRKSMQKTEEKDSQVFQQTPDFCHKAKESQKMEFDFEDEKNDSSAVKLNQMRTPKNLTVIIKIYLINYFNYENNNLFLVWTQKFN